MSRPCSDRNRLFPPSNRLQFHGADITGLQFSTNALDKHHTRLTLFAPAFHRPQFHGADITGLQFSADSAELVSVSMDASVCVWDAATGVCEGRT